ncbi:MAG: cell envelope integrity protein CreD [Spirochaetes bacterium]|nr:cell envelope integrity protein CreD [Spirochaetota bacterium]MBU1081927.1 cell envelope integrity protein CreD [Spirochaetota bacterium]
MRVIGKIVNGVGFKAALIAALALVMLIPAAMVRQLVNERSDRAEEVEAEILGSWGGGLEFAGPVLRVPCVRIEESTFRDDRGKETKSLREAPFDLWISPATVVIDAGLSTLRKERGIFSVPVFSGELAMEGRFDASEALASLGRNETARLEQAEMVIPIENQKGLRGIGPSLWAGRPLAFKPGDAGFGLLAGGVRAPVAVEAGTPAEFRVAVTVQGGGRIRVLPLGESARVSIRADWPSPSYRGDYLPGNQSLDERGFEAAWDVSYLSRGVPLYWTDSAQSRERLSRAFLGVDFLEVLDRYALSERAVKYALLFIVVPFITLFMLELFTRREVHPVQYLLAGIANLVFYLLLLSLSEHVPFGAAYVSAAAAVTLMIFLYSRSLFGPSGKAWSMGLVMAVSYLYLYVTLRSEDWALLIGAVGAFAAVGLVMLVTRNVDWFGRGQRPPA